MNKIEAALSMINIRAPAYNPRLGVNRLALVVDAVERVNCIRSARYKCRGIESQKWQPQGGRASESADEIFTPGVSGTLRSRRRLAPLLFDRFGGFGKTRRIFGKIDPSLHQVVPRADRAPERTRGFVAAGHVQPSDGDPLTAKPL